MSKSPHHRNNIQYSTHPSITPEKSYSRIVYSQQPQMPMRPITYQPPQQQPIYYLPQFPQQQISTIISTEKFEPSPDRFIARLKEELRQEKEKNRNLGNGEYWMRMYTMKEEELNQIKEYYEKKLKDLQKSNYQQENDIDSIKMQEQILQLQQELQQTYTVIDDMQKMQQDQIKQLQEKHRVQVNQLLEQIEENNKCLQAKSFNSNSQKAQRELLQQNMENEELRKQLLFMHNEFKRINMLMNELIQENKSLQRAYNDQNVDRINELEQLIKSTTEDNLQKSFEIQSLQCQLVEPSFQNVLSRLFLLIQLSNFKNNTSEELEIVKEKKNELKELFDECNQIKSQMGQSSNQDLDLKFQYQLLQDKIERLQNDIIDIYNQTNYS